MHRVDQWHISGLLLVIQLLAAKFVCVLTSRAQQESTITKQEKMSAVLPCTVYPDREMQVTWYKGSELIAQDKKILKYMDNLIFMPGIKFDEWNLEILRTDLSYDDVYTCRVDGKTVRRIRLIIQPAYNRFEHESQSYRVREPVNPNSSLVCEVDGYPATNITWATTFGEDTRPFRKLSKTFQKVSDLNNATRYNGDRYSCEVKSGIGVESKDVTLAVNLVKWCIDKKDDIWGTWWGYDLQSGPKKWHSNLEWSICQTGKNQSPINIVPQTLLFDPHLKPVDINGTTVNGLVKNTGRDVTFYVYDDPGTLISITSGPLSYTYRLYKIKFHFGSYNTVGSEHTVNGTSFPGEIHFIAYNIDLYANYSMASNSPRGIAILGVFISVGNYENSAFRLLSERFPYINNLHTCVEVFDLPIHKLIPETHHYMTYSGSLTHPGCKETVTWVLYNKPIKISQAQIHALRTLYQEWRGVSNTRPAMPLNHRTVRTNINVAKKSRLCSMEVSKAYQVNPNIGQ